MISDTDKVIWQKHFQKERLLFTNLDSSYLLLLISIKNHYYNQYFVSEAGGTL